MTKRRNARLYRAYMAIAGAAAAVAVVGGIFAVWATENTAAAPTVAPANVGEPSISGTARVGQVLRTTRGTWTGTGPISYSLSLVPLRWTGCAGRVRLSSDHKCRGQHVRPEGSRRRFPYQVASGRTERRWLGPCDVQSDGHRDLGTSDEHEGADDLRHRGRRKPSPGEPR